MSSNKLHPIYVALDNHNFTKAVKLCLAQPPSNTLAQALLAHAYARSGQRYKALLTLESILGREGFPELKLEIKYSQELRLEQQQQGDASAHAPTPAASVASSKKGGKKGKKKVNAATPTPPTPISPTANDLKDWDLVDQLDTPPTLPDGWEQLPPPEKALTDQTLLSTLSMTLLNYLKLPLSNYQLYCWAASTTSDDEETAVNKAYLAGFPVLVAPQYESLTPSILADMQVLALQLSRIQQKAFGVAPAAAWSAQTALWQLKYKDATPMDEKQEQRLAMLPRLAESLASKCVQQESLTTQEGLVSPEEFLLYLRSLDQQSKWEEMLTALNERLPELKNDERMSPPRQIMIDSKLDVLGKLKRYADCRTLLETELLKEYPDNWTYWKKHLDCSLSEADGNSDDGLARTEEMLAKSLSEMSERQYPLRGPRLMKVELAAVRMQRCKADESSERVAALIDCIIEYSDGFAARASCTFSDLGMYMELALDKCSTDDARSLVDRLSKFRVEPTSDDPKQRNRELRAYIFSVKMIYKSVSKLVELADQLPGWKDLLRVWRDFQSFERSAGQDQVSQGACILSFVL